MIAILLLVAACHAHGGLPDASCTPGATDPRVTQENLATTICRKGGYTTDVRNVPDTVKRDVCLPYGVKVVTTRDKRGRVHYSCGSTVEVDHLISLELGGSNEPANLWPELYDPNPGAHTKDVVENRLHAEVCAGRMTLKEAQREIASDWLAVYRSLTSAQRGQAAKHR